MKSTRTQFKFKHNGPFDSKAMPGFINAITQDKTAFDIFRKKAEHHGILEKQPQMQFQHDYFNCYIKPQQDSVASVRQSGTMRRRSIAEDAGLSSYQYSQQNFNTLGDEPLQTKVSLAVGKKQSHFDSVGGLATGGGLASGFHSQIGSAHKLGGGDQQDALSFAGSKRHSLLRKSVGFQKQPDDGFIPLRQLMGQNHQDRVQSYLDRMDQGDDVSEIVNKSSAKSKGYINFQRNAQSIQSEGPKPKINARNIRIFNQVQTVQRNQKNSALRANLASSLGVQTMLTDYRAAKANLSGSSRNHAFSSLDRRDPRYNSQVDIPNRVDSELSASLTVPKARPSGSQAGILQNQTLALPNIRAKADSKDFGATNTSNFKKGSHTIEIAQPSPQESLLSMNRQKSVRPQKVIVRADSPENSMTKHGSQPVTAHFTEKLSQYNGSEHTSDEGSSVMGGNQATLGIERKQSKKKTGQKLGSLKMNSVINSNFSLDRKNILFFNHFNQKIAIEKRVSKFRLREYLTQRYKEGFASKLVPILSPYFGNFIQNIDINSFSDGVETMFNQDARGLKDLAFRILDVSNDKKLSQNDVFEIMKLTSKQLPVQNTAQHHHGQANHHHHHGMSKGQSALGKVKEYISRSLASEMDGSAQQTSEILPLNKVKEDLFLDIFSDDYILIIKALEKKKEAVGFDEEAHRRKRMQEQLAMQALYKERKLQKQQKQQYHEDEEPSLLDKMKEKKDDHSFYLSREEFMAIPFENDWPLFISDLAKYLTGMNLLKTQKIKESDELHHLHNLAEFCKDSDLNYFRAKMNLHQYAFALNAFRAFQGQEKKLWFKKDIENALQGVTHYLETQLFLEEKDFVNNFKEVFGYDCPYFGKLLYLYMSKGYDRKKISLHRYLECLMPLFENDQRLHHNKIIFKILDVDRDGTLNVINILHLQKNVNPKTAFGQEIFKLMQFQIKNNIKARGINKERVNYDVFAKIVGKSCVIEEIRLALFGLFMEKPEQEWPASIFKEIPQAKFEFDYYFKDVNVMNDVSLGQRNFKRNLDGVLGTLVKQPISTNQHEKQNAKRAKPKNDLSPHF